MIAATLLLASLLTQPPATPPVVAPVAVVASEVTQLRAEVYLLKLRELQRQAADLEAMRIEVEAAILKETKHRIDWATGRLVPVEDTKGTP